ncbi:hypothetical protein O6H91_02G061700 [Diphasiastrum complanatum]|uniref:Uncharacterized protein n=1 Tax=Diphasiastrum complanatum TaxID=34168 RepID=A0ACC2EG42_DIPCM|nr:hypothetical protein O6H91_02G061700 [Diphasiastrum complanatum]
MTTPKAKLHQLYSNSESKPRYVTEAVLLDTSDQFSAAAAGGGGGGGGVSVSQIFATSAQPSFFCTLHLPDGTSVVSETCRRKKDAEQDAAQKALTQVHSAYLSQGTLKKATLEETWTALIARVEAAFSNHHVLKYKPLVEHFRIALKKSDTGSVKVPATVLSSLDTKIISLCQTLDDKCKRDPTRVVRLVCCAAKMSSSLRCDQDGLWICKVEPFSLDVKEVLLEESELEDGSIPQTEAKNVQFEAIYIPFALEKMVSIIQIVLGSSDYFLDVVAHQLGVKDGAHVLISRSVTKAPSGTRLYWSLPQHLQPVAVPQSEADCFEVEKSVKGVIFPKPLQYTYSERSQDEYKPKLKNVRASKLVGYDVYGDAILAAIGSSWQSEGKLSSSSISLASYYRWLLGRFPGGNYKLSRDALLTAELPTTYTSKTQWRGLLPRPLLFDFCHQYHLPDPVFFLFHCEERESISFHASEKCNGMQVDDDQEVQLSVQEYGKKFSEDFCVQYENGKQQRPGTDIQGPYKCKVKIILEDYRVVEFESERIFRNRNDAIQSAALKTLLSLDRNCDNSLFLSKDQENYDQFSSGGVLIDNATGADGRELKPSSRSLSDPLKMDQRTNKDEEIVDSMVENGGDHSLVSSDITAKNNPSVPGTSEISQPYNFEIISANDNVGKRPLAGSMVCVEYKARLVAPGLDQIIDANQNFEFELGSGAVIGVMDICVANLCEGQTARFHAPLPPKSLLHAAQAIKFDKNDDLQYGELTVEYTVTLLKVLEPPEERMESALFSPPLSKQRVDFALQLIEKIKPVSLVDLGCGSGSLLEAIVEQSTDLVHVAGVDISQRSIIRAAKALQTKLGKQHFHPPRSCNSSNSVALYVGSIAESDSRLANFDIATCIEVVEHMDSEPLSKIGESILGGLSPKVLMLSTPNIEYNPILQHLVRHAETPETASETINKHIDGESIRDVEEVEKHESVIKLRNDDHRFEWTRAEFRDWALRLASEYGYAVEFSGVGGSGDEDGPGFASQIAIFTRMDLSHPYIGNQTQNETPKEIISGFSPVSRPYMELWKWSSAALHVNMQP